MMKIAIRYFSRTGHMEKMAAVVSEVTGGKAETIDVPITEDTDILFFGSAVYMAGVDDKVKAYIASMDSNKVKNVICFSSAAILPSSYVQVRGLLEKQQITVDKREFHCRGQFKILHRGRPNKSDLELLRKFVEEIIP